ncbi:MAG: hypothetical protein ACRERZ_07910, partial [Gammaproteobacteria bacterium]
FEQASCESLPAWQGHVVILDTLHYLAAATQQQLLRSAAACVAPGAALVIRSVLRDTSWRFAITRLEEFLIHGIRWMRCRVQHYPDSEELRAPLVEAGLTIEIKPLWGRTPFNSYLIVARRAVEPSQTGKPRPGLFDLPLTTSGTHSIIPDVITVPAKRKPP